jgi:uncharacterized protein (DUF1800 family)
MPQPAHKPKSLRPLLAGLLAALVLAACGGGEEGQPAEREQAQARPTDSGEAHRFLTQATFGPRPEDIQRVMSIGYVPWIDEQLNHPIMSTHLQMVEASAAVKARTARNDDVVYSWWTHALADHNAQLRHRVAFALSEIFVVSTIGMDSGRMVASYMDMLTAHASGRYRDLLEAVALHPAMGVYLSHMGNRKEDGSGRVPDENFAREVMQLFSIGLHELDESGQPRLANGKPVEVYSASDIKGLARVFTGFSWRRVNASAEWWRCFSRNTGCHDDTQDVLAMSDYQQEHATTAKQFLGVTIPAQAAADPRASLRVALDTLARHPNTAPFISRQLIQRLVTSNPSNRYVADVARTFRNTDGDLRAVIKEILLHDEARFPATDEMRTFGKLREPVLRLAHVLRAIPHSSDRFASGGSPPFYLAVETSDPGGGLGQTPMRSPSVFNFFRPGYRPPQTAIGDAGLVAPEMQITTETTVLGYANFLSNILERGWGEWGSSRNRFDIQFDYGSWMPLATQPAELIDVTAQRLLGRKLPGEARTPAISAITAMPSGTDAQKRQRVQAAVLMVAVSPDFLIQQ